MENLLDMGMERAMAASQLVVIECTISGKSDLYSMRDLALLKLGLRGSDNTSTAQIVLAHSEKTGPEHAWRGLFHGAVGVGVQLNDDIPLGGDVSSGDFDLERGISLAVEHIEALESSGRLATYLLPEYYVTVPTVFMDMLDDPIGFIVFASGDNNDRITGMIFPQEYAARWISEIGQPLVLGTLPGAVPCNFGKVKDRLIREVRQLPS